MIYSQLILTNNSNIVTVVIPVFSILTVSEECIFENNAIVISVECSVHSYLRKIICEILKIFSFADKNEGSARMHVQTLHWHR